MFDVLPASKPLDRVRPESTLLASVIHGAILITAVLATRAVPSLVEPRREQPLFFPAPAPAAVARRDPTAVERALPTAPRFPVLPIPPLAVPAIAPVEIGRPAGPLNLQDLDDRPGGTLLGRSHAAALESTSAPLTAAEVDEPVVVLEQAQPRYPRALAEAGISGEVTLEFVVDTSGRVDPPSLRVVASSYDGFNEPAREAIRNTRFRPARFRDARVRQLVRQTIRFVGGS